MADLFNQQISATYSGLLKTTSSGVLTSSLTQITDGRGNGSPLYISTTVGAVDGAINFYNAYTFPSADGLADQVLSTNAGGVLSWVDVSGGDVLKTGTIVANEIAIWNDNDSTLRSDPTLTIDADHKITLYQPNSVPTDLESYNIGGGNIANTTGIENVGFGKDNLLSNTTGSYNLAIGKDALFSNTTGGTNVAIGRQSMYNNLGGSYNMALGSNALLSNTTGLRNVAIGDQAVEGNTSGSFNIGIGETALKQNTTASYQIAIGSSSLYLNNGGYNTAIGYEAIRNNTSGVQNTAIGYQSMRFSTTGDANTAIGYGSGGALTSGSYNVLIGGGNAITTGSSNVVIGRDGGSSIYNLSNRIIISDGDGNIRQRFDNLGKLTLSNYGIGTHTGTLANTLGVDSSGNVIEFTSGSGTVTGTGTATTLTKWSTGGTGIEDSIVTDDGTTLTVSGALSGTSATFSGTLETTTIQSYNAYPIYLFSTASTSNYEVLTIDKSATDARIRVYKSGTGSYRDLTFETGGSTTLRLASTGAATFSGALMVLEKIGTSQSILRFDGGDSRSSYFGKENAAGNYSWSSGGTAYATVICAYNQTAPIQIGHNSPSVTISSGGNVGIGTDSPSVRTEIAASVNGNPVTSGGTQTNGALRVRGSATNVLDIGQQSASPYGMWMQVGESTNLAVNYPLLLQPNGGNVGINNTIPSSFFGNASQLVVGDGSTSRGMTIYSSTGADGQIFFADGTTGADQYRGMLRYEHSFDDLVFFTNATEKVRITSGGVLQAKYGISFPNAAAAGGTIAATPLNAYEEGTWTASTVPSGAGTITLNLGINTGTYTRIGRQVTVVGYFSVASVSGTQTGLVYVNGLPFTNGTGSDHYSPVTVFINTMLSSATSVIQGFVSPNTKQIVLFRFSNGLALNVADSFKAGSELMFSLTYFV